jgi:hypothetical protein
MSLNVDMVREVVRHIEIMPERWYQNAWYTSPEQRERWVSLIPHTPQARGVAEQHLCGTTFCIAGWAARLGGYVDENAKPTDKGRAWMQRHHDTTPMDDEWWLTNNGQVNNADFWDEVGQEVLGLSDYETRIFGGGYATTVEQLKRNLTEDLGIVFEEGADPHAV